MATLSGVQTPGLLHEGLGATGALHPVPRVILLGLPGWGPNAAVAADTASPTTGRTYFLSACMDESDALCLWPCEFCLSGSHAGPAAFDVTLRALRAHESQAISVNHHHRTSYWALKGSSADGLARQLCLHVHSEQQPHPTCNALPDCCAGFAQAGFHLLLFCFSFLLTVPWHNLHLLSHPFMHDSCATTTVPKHALAIMHNQ